MVVLGVYGPHGCEDFTNQAEALLDRSLLDSLPLCGQKDRTDAFGEKFEEGNGILNVLDVGGDL